MILSILKKWLKIGKFRRMLQVVIFGIAKNTFYR